MSSALRIAMDMGLHKKKSSGLNLDGNMCALNSVSDTPCTKEYILLKHCMNTNPVYLQTTACIAEYLNYIYFVFENIVQNRGENGKCKKIFRMK